MCGQDAEGVQKIAFESAKFNLASGSGFKP